MDVLTEVAVSHKTLTFVEVDFPVVTCEPSICLILFVLPVHQY